MYNSTEVINILKPCQDAGFLTSEQLSEVVMELYNRVWVKSINVNRYNSSLFYIRTSFLSSYIFEWTGRYGWCMYANTDIDDDNQPLIFITVDLNYHHKYE